MNNNKTSRSSSSSSTASLITLSLLLLLVALQLLEFGLHQSACLFDTTSSSRFQEQQNSAATIKTAAVLFEEHYSNNNKNNVSLAFIDSLGFFTGISDSTWLKRRKIARGRKSHLHPSKPLTNSQNPRTWYQQNWEPNLACLNEEMVGNMGDGHKWICDPYRIEEMSHQRPFPCLVYSIGSKGNFDFEQQVHELMPSCDIHTFDFGNYTHKMPTKLRNVVHYHMWGLKPSYETPTLQEQPGFRSKYSGKLWESDPPKGVFKTIQETLKELGHSNRIIDIFKIDCEGCEYYSYKDWVDPSVDIRQIQVEVHDTPPIANDFFQALLDANFAMFHKEPNIQWAFGDAVEFAFMKMNKSYFGK